MVLQAEVILVSRSSSMSASALAGWQYSGILPVAVDCDKRFLFFVLSSFVRSSSQASQMQIRPCDKTHSSQSSTSSLGVASASVVLVETVETEDDSSATGDVLLDILLLLRQC
jgi:hypothetical protein